MAGRHKELKHMEIEILDDTQENTQNGNSNCSQDVESQTITEKEPWGRLFKKRILRRKVDPGKQKIVIAKEDERDYFGERILMYIITKYKLTFNHCRCAWDAVSTWT